MRKIKVQDITNAVAELCEKTNLSLSHELFTIGQMSKASGLSADTLRYYDKVGLICPQVVDKETGYRYYSVKQLWLTDMVMLQHDA